MEMQFSISLATLHLKSYMTSHLFLPEISLSPQFSGILPPVCNLAPLEVFSAAASSRPTVSRVWLYIDSALT